MIFIYKFVKTCYLNTCQHVLVSNIYAPPEEIWETKILRAIYGGTTIVEGRSERNNKNLYESSDKWELKGLSWSRHVELSNKERISKMVLYKKPFIDKWINGRPRKIWMRNVLKDLKTINVTNWIKKSRCDRKEWRRIVKEKC